MGNSSDQPGAGGTGGSVSAEVVDLLRAVVGGIGGVPRTGQEQMATAVAACLASEVSATLLVQAGTGTGKSLAYAVPAAAHAAQGAGAVVIATATLALQRQLADKDLPAVTEGLGELLDRPVTFEILKGRHNYVCLDRLRRGPVDGDPDGALFETPTSRLGRQATKLRSWAEQTQTGDRDEVDFQVDSRVWAGLSTSARECPGATSCRFGEDCFAEAARARCRSADIVVTNHAMLAIQLQGDVTVLPPHSAVIVDEAHELADRVTTALTRELSGPIVERAAGRARKFLEPDVHDALLDCGGFLADILTDRQPGRIRSVDGELLVALSSLRDTAKQSLSGLRAQAQDDPSSAADRTSARALVTALHETAGSLLTLGEYDVAWLEGDSNRVRAIRLAPLSVTSMLSEGLFGQRPTVLTSATLAYGGGLERTAVSLGAPGDSELLDVGSPFDYRKQAILYCARDLPRPGRDGPADALLTELGDLIEAAGGRTLALFSSWRGVDAAEDTLRRRFPASGEIPVLRAQRGEPVAQVIRQFLDVPESVLLGTLSLWQGVDVPGASCILVAIDRIPFPRPDDPLTAARQEYVDSHGGSGFASVSVPRAALLLAQGSGRLIRSASDRGVVAVLDPRLATAGYSRTLMQAMPPFFPTTDGSLVRAALRRLDAQVGS